jgi:hypothetical protein
VYHSFPSLDMRSMSQYECYWSSLKNDNAGSMPPQAPTFRAAPECTSHVCGTYIRSLISSHTASQNARQSQQQYEYPEPNSSSNSVPTSGPSAFTSKFQIQTASGSNDMAIDPALQALEGGANSLPTITMNGELLDFAIRMEGMPQQQTEADKAQDGQPNQHPDAGPLPQNPWEGQGMSTLRSTYHHADSNLGRFVE